MVPSEVERGVSGGMTSPVDKSSSVSRLFVFWWVTFVIIQQAERLFLLPETATLEQPTARVLVTTLGTGLVGDLVCATGALAVAGVLGILLGIPAWWGRERLAGPALYRRALNRAFIMMGCLLLLVLIADVGYYGFSQQRMNFVFFEYLDDLLRTSGNETGASQAAEQTAAELSEGGKWGIRLGAFLFLEALALGGWCLVFGRKIGPMLTRCETQRPVMALVMLMTILIGGWAGLGPIDLSGSQTMARAGDAYFNLAQNPVLFMGEPLRDAFLSQWSWAPRRTPGTMTVEEAVHLAQQTVRRGARFPFAQYPLVHEDDQRTDRYFGKAVNVILMFVEGLDRRYLDRTIDVSGGNAIIAGDCSTSEDCNRGRAFGAPSSRSIRLTPFLDRLKEDSLYFENFFSNGVATTRGLFSTFCSYYPRQGTSAIKSRFMHDYLCLPSLLNPAGFRTEMVIGLDSDVPGIRPFMERNGLDRLYGERDFPPTAERLGVGLTDGALFDFMRTRIEALQAVKQPFLLAALTSGTHHPFTVPLRDSDVRALQQHRDHYIAALHYFDLEFEKFFTGLQRDGLLKNSMVIVLGDHGRHEPVGQTDAERQAGRFLVPLLVWVDHSLRTPDRYRPRHIQRIASQVDVAPTILAVNGILPRVSPFVGRNLGCLFVDDCLFDQAAYLSSVYDDLIGLADRDGLWFYSFRRESLWHVDLKVHGPSSHLSITAPEAEERYRRILALYLASNTLLEQNRVWRAAATPP
jgi:hypothetical protein